ncbi:uncharacterized protein LOC114062878 [Empidonax traillii]|uniref:uncharacterized protein LOC114062878 n=1 Tax=Empidonax traillii TaxID=164674 RepID=UPI000FFD4A81|nr:uncharacterized protein LOC114062878 [Empidonax traillii]
MQISTRSLESATREGNVLMREHPLTTQEPGKATFQLCLQHPKAFDAHSKYTNTVVVMKNTKDHSRRKVVMGEVGAWLPWAGEALQLQYTCLNGESTASCHHSSPGERGQHCTWLCSSTAKGAPGATSSAVTYTQPLRASGTHPTRSSHARGGHWQEWGEVWHAHSPQAAPLACDQTGTRKFISKSLALARPQLDALRAVGVGRWADGCSRPGDTEHSTHNAASVHSTSNRIETTSFQGGIQAQSHHWHRDSSPKWQSAPVDTAACNSSKDQGHCICPPTG